jgi:hypothetical protein
MSDYIATAAFWLVPFLAVGAYLFTHRLFPSSRSLLVFDSAVLFLVPLLCGGFCWREITGHISTDIWVDERGFMLILVPMWTSIIAVPLLLMAALARLVIFARPHSDSTRAI